MKIFFLLVGSIFLFVSESNGASDTCSANQYQVRGHFRRGYVKSDGTVVKPTNVRPYCKQLSEAFAFSKERFKKGWPPGWPHRSEKITPWTIDEKERIIEALDELPDFLLTSHINGIYRLKKSKDFPNPASNTDHLIVVYDSAFESSRNLARILSHELSHQNYKDLSEEERRDYRLATGWTVETDVVNRAVYWVGRKSGYVQDDGKISQEEDYSNNLEHYLYDPDKLKKETPSAFDWLKKKFGDKLQLKRQKK